MYIRRMASRVPRTSFAASFVVTVAACGGSSPPPTTPQPPPTTSPVQPEPIAEPTAGTDTTVAQGPAQTGGVEPAKFEQKWRVTKSGDTCQAFVPVDCPKPEAGKPTMTCNPPPPIRYACPPNVTAPFEIVLREGATECFVVPPAIKCPPKAMCNPPPPQKVECPKR